MINPNLEIACEHLTKRILFGSLHAAMMDDTLCSLHLQYRKNKDISHIKRAIARGLRQGMAKTEMEIQMVTLHLCSVLKLK